MGVERSIRLSGLSGVAGGFAPLDSGLLVPASYLPSGTAMPSQPGFGNTRRFWRTDLGMEFYYDGTQWLCTCLHFLAMPEVAGAGSTGAGQFVVSPRATLELWLVKLQMATLVLTTNNGSAFWTVKLSGKVGPNTETDVASATASTGTTPDTHTTWTRHDVTLGAALSSSYLTFYMIVTKTSTPGNLYCTAGLDYRYIGT